MLIADSTRPTPTAASHQQRLRVFAAVIGIVVAIAAGLGAPYLRALPALAPYLGQWSAAPFNGGQFEPPLAVPVVTMQRADGGEFSTAANRGRIGLYFFGYTNCPDVCPTTLGEMARVRRDLGQAGRRLDIYFVTVDPARDTPTRLREYVARWDPTIVALTGSAEQVDAIMRAFGVVAERRELPNSRLGYAVDHTAGVFVVDGEGRFRLLFPFGLAEEDIEADLRRLLGWG